MNSLTPAQASSQSEVAARIAQELGRTEGACKLTKVTSLLSAFRTPGGSTRLDDVTRLLDAHGVSIESGWPPASGIRRSGVLQVSLPGNGRATTSETDSGVHVTVWPSGEQPRDSPYPPTEEPEPGALLWFNIDSAPVTRSTPRDSPEASLWRKSGAATRARTHNGAEDIASKRSGAEDETDIRATHLFEDLHRWCPGLTLEMIRDLLREDPHPKVEAYGDESGAVRAVSVVGAIGREMPGHEDDSDNVSEQVVFQAVEIVVGTGWILTCWHRSHVLQGAGEEAPETSVLEEPFLCQVRRSWCAEGHQVNNGERPQTSSDLGMFLVRSLIDTYDATHRMMEAWMADWEVAFYTALKSPDKAARLREAAAEISELLCMSAEIRRRLTAFEHAQRSTADRSWFPMFAGDPAHTPDGQASQMVSDLARIVNTSRETFDHLSSDIRANMDVLMLQSNATQQEATERVQSSLGLITGLVLVPTLIVGLFGANTELPGRGNWMGFEIMLVAMVLSAVVVFLFIRKLRP